MKEAAASMSEQRGLRKTRVGMVDERFVLIADGDTRKAEHPKKKQVKHLRALPALATDALEPVARHGCASWCCFGSWRWTVCEWWLWNRAA